MIKTLVIRNKYNLTFINKTYIYKLKYRKTKTRNKTIYFCRAQSNKEQFYLKFREISIQL